MYVLDLVAENIRDGVEVYDRGWAYGIRWKVEWDDEGRETYRFSPNGTKWSEEILVNKSNLVYIQPLSCVGYYG